MTVSAFLQVDVDGLWAVRRCYGRPERGSFRDDPVWSEGLPRARMLFTEYGLPASFFLVGRDLTHPAKRREAEHLFGAGHEIANHSWSHRIGLTRLPLGRIREEIERCAEAIQAAGLPRPAGFRSPGYDIDARILRTLGRLGYSYDASMLPTFLSPALRAADALLARRIDPEKRQFGRLAYGRAPRVPYAPNRWQIRSRARNLRQRSALLELPVSTLPPFGLPLTGSAIFALGPERIARHLREARGPVLLLLHGIDFVDCSRPIIFDTRRPRVGGFDLSWPEKERLLRPVLEALATERRVVRADHWVAARRNRP